MDENEIKPIINLRDLKAVSTPAPVSPIEPEEKHPEARPGVLLEWEALEYDHLPKDKRWFLIGGVIAAAIILYGLFTANYFLSLLTIIAGFLVFVYAVRPPKMIYSAVTSRGVQIGRRIFLYEDLNSFWIFYEAAGMKELSLESKKAVVPFIRVPLGEIDPVEIRELLIRFVPERQHEESFAETIGHLVGF